MHGENHPLKRLASGPAHEARCELGVDLAAAICAYSSNELKDSSPKLPVCSDCPGRGSCTLRVKFTCGGGEGVQKLSTGLIQCIHPKYM